MESTIKAIITRRIFNMKKLFILVFGLVLIFSSACSSVSNDINNSEITITDAFGKEIYLSKPAGRIISTYSAITENIYALGAGELLIGGGSTEAYPEEAVKLPSFSYSKDDVEKFIAAKPDVVFFRKTIAIKYTDLINNLEKVGIIVIALDNEDFESYINTIAKVVGREETAKTMLDEFKKQLEDLRAKAAKIPEEERVSVFFESAQKDYKTASQKSIVYAGLKLIGVNNVADENMEKGAASTIAHFGEEYLLAEANNIDIYIAQYGAMNRTVNIESIKKRPGFNVIKAIKENQIYIIEEKLISSPTFRQVDGLRQLFEYIYPEY